MATPGEPVAVADEIEPDGDGIPDLADATEDAVADPEVPPVVEDTEAPPPPPPADPRHEALLDKMQTTTNAAEQTAIQEQVIEGQVEQAEDLNDELADIIQELRRKKGLPAKKPYTSPLEVAAVEQLQQMEEEVIQENELLPDEPETLDAAAPTEPEQAQEQVQEDP